MTTQPLHSSSDIYSPAQTRSSGTGSAGHVSLVRLYVLRLGYLLVGVGLVLVKWPELVVHPQPWPLFESVVTCMLVALSLLAFLGLRYPLKMLPALLFEATFKFIWVGVVFIPLWVRGQLDAATTSIFYSCLVELIVLAVIPWRYVFSQYVTAAGDPWRARPDR